MDKVIDNELVELAAARLVHAGMLALRETKLGYFVVRTKYNSYRFNSKQDGGQFIRWFVARRLGLQC